MGKTTTTNRLWIGRNAMKKVWGSQSEPQDPLREWRAKMSLLKAAVLGLSLAAFPWFVMAGDFVGQASIIDGDTIEIRGQRIRLTGMDAPESRQLCHDAAGRPWRCGQQAALALDAMVARRPVVCTVEGTDRYGRVLAVCAVGGRDLAGWMIENGWAVAYYDRLDRHSAAERDARTAGRGIWAGTFQRPEDWRRQN